jgi:hypothetical protein
VAVAGRGQAGVLGAYAALWDPAIAEVVLVEPTSTHRDGPIFLNVLRVLDVPDAVGLLAPRRVRLVNAGEPFDRTIDIFRAGGAGRIERQ